MADVLLNRLDHTAVLEMLYIDNEQAVVPPTVRQIVSELVAGTITKDDARKRILAWKETINGKNGSN